MRHDLQSVLTKRMILMKRSTLALVIFSVLLMLPSLMYAQTPAGKVHGHVTDPSGAVIPGASIVLRNTSGLMIAAKSGSAGAYELKSVAPGTYTLLVGAKGFAPVKQDLVVVAGQDKK